MRKLTIIICLVMVVLFSCKPIVYPRQPAGGSDLAKLYALDAQRCLDVGGMPLISHAWDSFGSLKDCRIPCEGK